MTSPCTHHWDIEAVHGHVSKARCLLCGAEKTMANYLENSVNSRGRLVWRAPEFDQETPGKEDSMAKGVNPHERADAFRSLREQAMELGRAGKTIAEIRAMPGFQQVSYSTLYAWLPARPKPAKVIGSGPEAPKSQDPEPARPAPSIAAQQAAGQGPGISQARLPPLLQTLVEMLPQAVTASKKSQWLDAFDAIYAFLYLDIDIKNGGPYVKDTGRQDP